MNEPLSEPQTVWRFMRRYSVRIVIGAVLLLVVMIAIRLDAAFRLEQSIADKITLCGGEVTLAPVLPNWVPKILRDRFCLVVSIRFKEHPPSDDVLSDIGALRGLVNLSLMHPSTSDSDLRQLERLIHLQILNLSNSQVSDAGLKHLYGMKKVVALQLRNTNVSEEGRTVLRKALPGCKITPDP